MTTLCSAFQSTIATHPDRIALRSADGSQQYTFAEYGDEVRRLASAFSGLGVGPGDAVALMMRNRPECHLLDAALLHLGAVPFSVYNTLSGEQITHVLRDSGARLAVVEAIFSDAIAPAVAATGTRVLSLEAMDVWSRTPAAPGFDFEAAWRAVVPSDLVTLIYTSGTTGPSKGVQITHGGELAQCYATNEAFAVVPGDRIISFLPTAHIADRWLGHYTNMIAATELTCLADIKLLAPAIAQVRPTIFGGVPQVWSRIFNGVRSAVEAMAAAEDDPQRKGLLAGALEAGYAYARQQDAGVLEAATQAQFTALDAALFTPLRAKLGLDECRVAISGAAPIPTELLLRLRGLGIPISSVLGLSELSGMTTWSAPGDAPASSVGAPIAGVEVATADDGELLVRGPVLMRSYRNLPEQSAAAIDADGWLHTGDLASISHDGAVTIVDRKKEIMVNDAGKNLSPIAIESAVLSALPLAAYVVAIGDARPHVTAMIVLDPEALAAFATEHGLTGALATDPLVLEQVRAGVERANATLSRPEQVRNHIVVADDWEPGSVLLTPTRKLRRKAIHGEYSARIEALYPAPSPAQ